jgi:hypothetical protein
MVDDNVKNIAFLGWDSSITDTSRITSFVDQNEQWQENGPSIPLEFSRKCRKKGNSLTVVVDPEHGTECRVFWCFSKRKSVEDAVKDLRIHDGTTRRNIVSLSCSQTQSSKLEDGIKKWAQEKNIEHVLWLGHSCNFPDFSIEAGAKHLERLPAASRKRAVRYISTTNSSVRTGLRTFVERCDWYLAELSKLRNCSAFGSEIGLQSEESSLSTLSLVHSMRNLYQSFLKILSESAKKEIAICNVVDELKDLAESAIYSAASGQHEVAAAYAIQAKDLCESVCKVMAIDESNVPKVIIRPYVGRTLFQSENQDFLSSERMCESALNHADLLECLAQTTAVSCGINTQRWQAKLRQFKRMLDIAHCG